MMASPRRHALVLVLVLGVVAFVAQLAGVGGNRPAPRAAKQKVATLAVVPGGAVPDITSTTLASSRIRAKEGDVLQMRGEAIVRARTLRRGTAAQVVCGLRYARSGDASWSLGTPYETVVLERRNARERVRIERSFSVPATDTYRVSVACHVSAPERGAKVTATGATRFERGLPAGAATPVE